MSGEKWGQWSRVSVSSSGICRGRHERQYLFGIRSIRVSLTKMEVGRDVTGGLGSKSKKWELVARDT